MDAHTIKKLNWISNDQKVQWVVLTYLHSRLKKWLIMRHSLTNFLHIYTIHNLSILFHGPLDVHYLCVCVCVCERVVRGCLSFQQTMLYALTTSCPGIYRFVPSDAAVQHGTRNAWLQSFTVAQQCNHQQVRSERRHRRLVR